MPDSLQIVAPQPKQVVEHSGNEVQASSSGDRQSSVSVPKKTESPRRVEPNTQSYDKESVETEGVETDTLPQSVKKVIVISNPKASHHVSVAKTDGGGDSASWVLLGMLVLFLLVAFRLRRNFRYLKGLLQETVSSRSRQNMFVDTMRETTFVIILNVLCVVSVALFLAEGVALSRGEPVSVSGELPPGLWGCLLVTGGYYCLQWIAYIFTGNIFTTSAGTSLWLQGFRAGQGLLGLLLFPAAMLSIFYPAMLMPLSVFALIMYFASRLLFIFKGIRIFSSRPTYYFVFLYYLCGVEIVPVFLVWDAVCLWG